MTCLRLAVALAALTAPLAAQWLDHPTPGVPRTKDAKPNLSAPAPRTREGKPDLSGVWYLETPPCGPGCGDYPGAPEFMDIASKLPGGLPYQPWAAELVKKRAAEIGRDDPVARCLPSGVVRLLTFPPPRKIVQLPGLVLILSERDVTFQQIFTDGRPLPSDPAPNWNGYSSGKWEGDALVVHINGLRDGTWLDRKGDPLTEAAALTERFRRVNYGRLAIDLTVDDPKAYTRPWTVTLNQILALDTDLLDYYCMDNEKDAQHVVGK
ncbi:MAG: hypothetical protein LAP40_14025 [Acidobacteriia bacterium]|nr:hypothetical protein [Terriglobia bacterium]